MYSQQNRLRELAVELARATAEGALLWSATEDEHAFQAEMRFQLVIIERIAEEHPDTPYLLTVLNDHGLLAGSYAPIDEADQQHLRSLWDAALRSAPNAEVVGG